MLSSNSKSPRSGLCWASQITCTPYGHRSGHYEWVRGTSPTEGRAAVWPKRSQQPPRVNLDPTGHPFTMMPPNHLKAFPPCQSTTCLKAFSPLHLQFILKHSSLYVHKCRCLANSNPRFCPAAAPSSNLLPHVHCSRGLAPQNQVACGLHTVQSPQHTVPSERGNPFTNGDKAH